MQGMTAAAYRQFLAEAVATSEARPELRSLAGVGQNRLILAGMAGNMAEESKVKTLAHVEVLLSDRGRD